MKVYIRLAMFFVLNLGAMIGVKLGEHMASDHFYDECQSGEVYFVESGKGFNAVGCAEIARHIR